MITEIQLGVDKKQVEYLREQLLKINPYNVPLNLHACTEEQMKMINEYYIFTFVNQMKELYGIAVVQEEKVYPNNEIVIPYYFKKETISIRESGNLVNRVWDYISHICFEGNKKLSRQNLIFENDIDAIQEMLFLCN